MRYKQKRRRDIFGDPEDKQYKSKAQRRHRGQAMQEQSTMATQKSKEGKKCIGGDLACLVHLRCACKSGHAPLCADWDFFRAWPSMGQCEIIVIDAK